MAVTLSAGGSLQWLRNTLPGLGYGDLTALAAGAPVGAEGCTACPTSAASAPHLAPRRTGPSSASLQ